jgi:hypothetical protein
VTDREDLARNGRALIDLQLKLIQQATSAMAVNAQRLQEDVDAILHAFAMMPVAADRAIRSAVVKQDAAAPPRPRPARQTRRKPARGAGEHAR